MARIFDPITKDELCEKIKVAAVPLVDNDCDPELREYVLALIQEGAFDKDLKVDMDFENFECMPHEGYNGCKGLTGPQHLDTGLSFVGCCAGGDWQVPVFFVIYWDGKKLRAYVPTDGNTWNTDTNSAYGDDARSDYENAKTRYPELVQEFDEQLHNDAESRERLGLPEDHFDFDITNIPECDPLKILDDLRGRITSRSESLEVPAICDGFKVTRSGEFIVVQPTRQGNVRGHGLMMTKDMAAEVAKEIAKLL